MIQKLKASHSAVTKLFYDPGTLKSTNIGNCVKRNTREGARWYRHLFFLQERFKEFPCFLDHSTDYHSQTPPSLVWMCNSSLSDQFKIAFAYVD